MRGTIPYHHPTDERLSLTYVTTDREEINNDDGVVERFDLATEFFALYTNDGPSGTTDDLEDGFEAILDEMPADDRLIALRLLQIFEGIIDETEQDEGNKLRIYKQIELGEVPAALEHVDWSVSAVDVAAQLMSTLVLKHPLPNANHRAAISLAEWYLESTEPSFSFPEFATTDYDWQHWVDAYIAESKRIITVRRNTTIFSLLAEWGCSTVVRKGDIEIDLSEYDLSIPSSEALRHYADQHTVLCTEFMMESVNRSGFDHLNRIRGPAKAAFVEYLENSV